MRSLFLALLATLAALQASADSIKLKSGETLDGVSVLLEGKDSVLIAFRYASLRLDRSEVASIERKQDPAPAAKPRLAGWKTCLQTVAKRPWAGELRQIPSTVIDKGILKHVPYLSHKSGDTEFNIYGDPDRPACVEIGLYKDLRHKDDARKECIDAIVQLLGDPKDQELLRSLKLFLDKKERDGLTFEVTPDTAPDAYGGWWISVYDAKLLDEQRVDPKDIAKITEKSKELPKAPTPPAPGIVLPLPGWTQDDLSRARPDYGVGLIWSRGYYRIGVEYAKPAPPK